MAKNVSSFFKIIFGFELSCGTEDLSTESRNPKPSRKHHNITSHPSHMRFRLAPRPIAAHIWCRRFARWYPIRTSLPALRAGSWGIKSFRIKLRKTKIWNSQFGSDLSVISNLELKTDSLCNFLKNLTGKRSIHKHTLVSAELFISAAGVSEGRSSTTHVHDHVNGIMFQINYFP